MVHPSETAKHESHGTERLPMTARTEMDDNPVIRDAIARTGGDWVFLVKYYLNGVLHDVEGVYTNQESARLGALAFIQHQRDRLAAMAAIEQASINVFTVVTDDISLVTSYHRVRVNT